ncbi:MAG: FKBP-type peptidyl-prolyl cis-trans isomerase [Bacteroidia bacterium]|nr:FKBP-type peptidyl-prolyl cis-trans isomerase [Bacteroidia bacterium]
MKKIAFLIPFLILFSCKKKSTVDQPAEDAKIITQYISDHNLTATATGSGLYYVMTSQGNGAQPTINSNVTVKYKGYLTNGTVFDQTTNVGSTFSLNDVIKGWQEGMPLFKKGGKGMLLIPSALGYGSQAQNGIPANSVIIFDVELLDVK